MCCKNVIKPVILFCSHTIEGTPYSVESVFLCAVLMSQSPFFSHRPFLAFLTLYLDLTSVRATASYLFEGLVAAAIEPYATDCGRVSAVGCEGRFLV